MQKNFWHWLMIANVVIGANASAQAQAVDTGKIEYLSKCAVCHGFGGKGDGPLSRKLKKKPLDLTTLAKKSNGEFPAVAIYGMIDGRGTARAHKESDMPIWGCRHTPPDGKARTRPSPLESHFDLACDPEPVIHSRIEAVVEYLRRIQE
jgi:mono/diheme cytochrome c family protein